MKQQLYKNESGVVLILLAISITSLIGFIGLAIDIGNLYRTNLYIQKTADAAALSAVKFKIANGLSAPEEMKDMAISSAMTNLQMSGKDNPGMSYIVEGAHKTEWDTANERMYFTAKDTTNMMLLPIITKNTSSQTTQITAEAERAPANLSIILDISGSMACPIPLPSDTDPDFQCTCRLDNDCEDNLKIDRLKYALNGEDLDNSANPEEQGFLDHFNPLRDRINIVPFNTAARLLRSVRDSDGNLINGFDTDTSDAVSGLEEVKNLIDGLTPSSATNISDGLLTAFSDYISVLPDEEVTYILFSDGAPTAAKTWFISRGTGVVSGYYQNYAVDFVDPSNNIFKGVSPFIRDVPYESDPSLSLFNHNSGEALGTQEIDMNNPYLDTQRKVDTFFCGEPVRGCDFIDETGQTTLHDTCDEFSEIFNGDDKCNRGSDFIRYNPAPGIVNANFRSLYANIYEHFYNAAIVASDAIRHNNGTVHVIALGNEKTSPTTASETDPYQDKYDNFSRKDFFLNRLARGQDANYTRLDQSFNINQYTGVDNISAVPPEKNGEYLPTNDADALRELYIKIAQRILIKLVR